MGRRRHGGCVPACSRARPGIPKSRAVHAVQFEQAIGEERYDVGQTAICWR
jgi:hypothetical protein